MYLPLPRPLVQVSRRLSLHLGSLKAEDMAVQTGSKRSPDDQTTAGPSLLHLVGATVPQHYVSQLSDVWAQTAAHPNSQILRMIQYTKHSRPSLSMVSVTRGHLRAENIKRKMPERHDSWMLDRMPC